MPFFLPARRAAPHRAVARPSPRPHRRPILARPPMLSASACTTSLRAGLREPFARLRLLRA
ncbi:hypothetical protein A33M_2032 [Rhodovulum sp. PH10]|nr:hypothetical protein A33M_2032 [Rhodovulum sp. PH10]